MMHVSDQRSKNIYIHKRQTFIKGKCWHSKLNYRGTTFLGMLFLNFLFQHGDLKSHSHILSLVTRNDSMWAETLQIRGATKVNMSTRRPGRKPDNPGQPPYFQLTTILKKYRKQIPLLITVRTTTPSSRKVADCRPSYWWPCLLGHRAHPRLFRFSFACRGVLSGSCYSASHHAVTVTVHESLRESIGFGNLVSAEGNLLILPNFRATGQHLKNNDHFSFLVLFL